MDQGIFINRIIWTITIVAVVVYILYRTFNYLVYNSYFLKRDLV